MTDPAPGSEHDLPHDLAGLVMMTARRMRRARMEALRPYGLTPQQAGAFLIVARHSRHDPHAGAGGGRAAGATNHGAAGQIEAPRELRLSDLAQRLRIAPRSVTEVVDALCEKDLVQRRPSPTDRRATIVVLTDAGERLHTELAARRPGATDLFAPLTTAEQEQLRALLSRLHETDDGS